MSDLLSVWGCETFCKVSGSIHGKNSGIGVFVSPFFSGAALVFGLLALVASEFRLGVHPLFSGVRTHPSTPLPFSGVPRFPIPRHRLAKALAAPLAEIAH